MPYSIGGPLMEQTEYPEKHPDSRQRSAALYVLCGFVVCITVMLFFYLVTNQALFLLAAILPLLPMLLNLILMLPRGQEQVLQDSPEPEMPLTRFQKARQSLQSIFLTVGNWYARKSRYVILGLLLAVTAALTVGFVFTARDTLPVPVLSYAVPVAMVVLLILFVVLDKLCKHTQAEDAASSDYDSALLRSLHSALILADLAVILVLAVSLLSFAGFEKALQYPIWGIELLFGYEVVSILFSLAVRLIRREFDTAPALVIPLPGGASEDFSVLSYLEQNTGMTMRSLWSMRFIRQTLPYAVMGIVLLLWFFSGVVMIGSHQQGSHYRLGKLMDEPLMPGLHLTLPWPIDQVEVYDTETVSKLTIGYVCGEAGDNTWTQSHGGEEYKLLLGGGKELVSINLQVEYKISDLHAYVESSTSPEMLLQAAAYETITGKTISTDLETLLAADRTALAASLRQEITERIRRYDTGLSVVSVVLESIHPPVEIAEVYQQIISAGIDAQKLVLEAQADADVRIAAAKRSYNEILSAARVDYYSSLAQAKSQVAEFMASVEADRDYSQQYRYYKYLNALSQSYANGKLVLVGEGIDKGNIFIGNFAGKAYGGN